MKFCYEENDHILISLVVEIVWLKVKDLGFFRWENQQFIFV